MIKRYLLLIIPILNTFGICAQRSEILNFISNPKEPNAKRNITILDVSDSEALNLEEVIIKLLAYRARTIVVSVNPSDYKESEKLDSLLNLHYVITRTSDNFTFEVKRFKRSRKEVVYKFPKRMVNDDSLVNSHCAISASLSYNWLIFEDIYHMDKETEFYIDYDGGPCYWSFQTIPFNELDEWMDWMDNKLVLIANFEKEEKFITPFDEFMSYDYMNETPYGTSDFHCLDDRPGMHETYILGHMINTLLSKIPRDTESIIVKE